MLRWRQENPEEFERTYHRRSLVESVFSSLKARFGAVFAAKTLPLQRLQLILRSICYHPACRSQTACAGRMPLPQRTLRRATTISLDPGSPAIGMREGTAKPQELLATWHDQDCLK